MRPLIGLTIILLTLVSAGWSSETTGQGSAGSPGVSALEFPATYSGTVPCEDCIGIRLTITLRPDGIFFLRQTWRGLGEESAWTFRDLGLWTMSADGFVLSLAGGGRTPRQLVVRDAGTLRMLDPEGKEAKSDLGYELIRVRTVDAFEEPILMRGMFSYMSDAGRFRECLTGRDIFVAHEGDNAGLESAYLAAPKDEPGAPVPVSLDGHFAMRPKMDGEGTEEVLIVDRFHRVEEDGSCGETPFIVPLEGPYWKLVELNGRPVRSLPWQRGPYLRLNMSKSTVSGSGGCNRFMGSYEREGNRLRFSGLAMTRMFCEGIMEQESGFSAALEAVGGYEIVGDTLLLTSGDNVMAKFRVVYLR